MGVLFFTFWYPTKENPVLGIFIKNHAISIHQSGIPIQVLAVNVKPSKKIYHIFSEHIMDENGIETHYIHIHSRFHKWIFSMPFILSKIIKLYISRHIEIKDVHTLHSNVLFPCGVVANSIVKKYNWIHVHTEHWSKMDHFIKSHPFGYLGKKTLREVKKISAVSAFLKHKIIPFVNNPGKISIIPNVINTSIFNFCDLPHKHETNDSIVFTAIATWNKPKCPIYFIQALNEIQLKSDFTIKLNIVGEGVLLDEIKALDINFEINYIGKKNSFEIREIFQSTHYFLHASTIETFSVVIAESLCCGIPVVASNVGAIPELINTSNGVLSENSVDSWVDAINKVLNTNFDRNLIASESAEKFNTQKVGDLFVEFYKNFEV